MTTPSPSRPVDPLLAAFAAGLASILFLTSWALIHRGFYKRDQIVDTPVYHRYGTAMDDGRVPYRDFGLEYPPGALPVFVIPALGDADFQTFTRRFEGFMAVCGLALVAFVAAALVALGAGARRLAAALGFVALAPLAAGSVVLSRFDLWPVALTAAAASAKTTRATATVLNATSGQALVQALRHGGGCACQRISVNSPKCCS